MLWGVEDFGGGAGLDEFASGHDQDGGAEVFDDGEVVRDEEVGEGELVLEILEEVDDLGLDGDIEGADRLVADEEFGFDGQGTGDSDPLPLASGELVGIAVQVSGVEADEVEEFGDSLAASRGLHVGEVDAEGLSDNVLDSHSGVERVEGVLKDHLDPFADGEEGGGVEGGQVETVEADGARGNGSQADDGFAGGGFSAAAFSDESDGGSFGNGEGDSIDGFDPAGLALEQSSGDGEVDAKVGDFEKHAVVFLMGKGGRRNGKMRGGVGSCGLNGGQTAV